jgi:hypothetical protein
VIAWPDTVGTVNDADTERRSRLLGLKLRALVRDHLADESVGAALGFAPGAALRHGDEAWVLLDDRPASMLGAALAWMLRSGASSLHVIAEQGTGVLARRAAEFTPPISVWHADGRSLLPAVAEPHVAPPVLPEHHEQFRQLISDAGAEPQVEHGVLFGDVRGLEVCRVVDDVHLGSTRLEVGVGAHDREAFQMIHGDIPTAASLRRIVDVVLQHRRVGAPQHPLNRLAAERFLRWRVTEDPSTVGAVSMAVATPPVPRQNLKDPVPCVATGTDADGRRIVVVCASGVDLDLVPYAADARLAVETVQPGVGEGDRLVLVTPARDRVPVIGELAGLLRQPAEFSSLD